MTWDDEQPQQFADIESQSVAPSDDSNESDDDISPGSSANDKVKPKRIASKESYYVLVTKLLVLVVLTGCATAAAIISYQFTKDNEDAEFENQVCRERLFVLLGAEA